MRDQLTISISTVYEARHFTLKFSTLKFVLFSAVLSVLVVIGLVSSTVWLWQAWSHSEQLASARVDRVTAEFGRQQAKDVSLIRAYEHALTHQARLMLMNEENRADLRDRLDQIQEHADTWQNAYQSLMDKLDIADQNKKAPADKVSFKSVKLDASMKHLMQTIIPSGYPVTHFRWSDGFGWRTQPITGKQEFHKGQDLAAPAGTPIYAPADGVVAYAGRVKGYGNFLEINNGFGFVTRYGHLSKALVDQGQVVTRGQKIAIIGNTGLSTGPHLHYEVRFLGDPLNPKPFMKWTRHDFNSIMPEEDKVPWGSLAELVRQQVLASRKQLLQTVAKSEGKSDVKVVSISTDSSKEQSE